MINISSLNSNFNIQIFKTTPSAEITENKEETKEAIFTDLLSRGLINHEYKLNFEKWNFPPPPFYLPTDIPQEFHLYWNKINCHYYEVTEEISIQVRDYLKKICKEDKEEDIERFIQAIKGRIFEKELSFKQIFLNNWRKNALRSLENDNPSFSYLSFECLGGWVIYILTHSERWLNETMQALFQHNCLTCPQRFNCNPSLYRPELDMKIFIRKELNPNLINDQFLIDYLTLFTGEVENPFYYRVLFEHLILKNGKTYPSSLISNGENQLDTLFVQEMPSSRLFATDDITINLDFYFFHKKLSFKYQSLESFYQAIFNIYFEVDHISFQANDKGIPKLISKMTQGIYIPPTNYQIFNKESLQNRTLSDLFLDHHLYHNFEDQDRFFVFLLNAFLILSKVKQTHLQSKEEIWNKVSVHAKDLKIPFLIKIRKIIESNPEWINSLEKILAVALLSDFPGLLQFKHEQEVTKVFIQENLAFYLSVSPLEALTILMQNSFEDSSLLNTLLEVLNFETPSFDKIDLNFFYRGDFFKLACLMCLRFDGPSSILKLLTKLCLHHPKKKYQSFIQNINNENPINSLILFFGNHKSFSSDIKKMLLSMDKQNLLKIDISAVLQYYGHHDLKFAFNLIDYLNKQNIFRLEFYEIIFRFSENTPHNNQLFYHLILNHYALFPPKLIELLLREKKQILKSVIELDLMGSFAFLKKLEKLENTSSSVLEFYYECLRLNEKVIANISDLEHDFEPFFQWLIKQEQSVSEALFKKYYSHLKDNDFKKYILDQLNHCSQAGDVAKFVEILLKVESLPRRKLLKDVLSHSLIDQIDLFVKKNCSLFFPVLSKLFYIKMYKMFWNQYFDHLFKSLSGLKLNFLTNLLSVFKQLTDFNFFQEFVKAVLANRDFFNARSKEELTVFFNDLINTLGNKGLNLYLIVGFALELEVKVDPKFVSKGFNQLGNLKEISQEMLLKNFSIFKVYFDKISPAISLPHYINFLHFLINDNTTSNETIIDELLFCFGKLINLNNKAFFSLFNSNKIFTKSFLVNFLDRFSSTDSSFNSEKLNKCILLIFRSLQRLIKEKQTCEIKEINLLLSGVFNLFHKYRINEYKNEWFLLLNYFKLEDFSLFNLALHHCHLPSVANSQAFQSEVQKYFCFYAVEADLEVFTKYFRHKDSKEGSWLAALQIDSEITLPQFSPETGDKIFNHYRRLKIEPANFCEITKMILENSEITEGALFLINNLFRNYVFCLIIYKKQLVLKGDWEKAVSDLFQLFGRFIGIIKISPLRIPFFVFLRFPQNLFLKELENKILQVLLEEVFKNKDSVLYCFLCGKIQRYFTLYGCLNSDLLSNPNINLVKFLLLRKELSVKKFTLINYDKLFDFCTHVETTQHFELFRIGLQYIQSKEGRCYLNEILKIIILKKNTKFSTLEKTSVNLYFSLLLKDQLFEQIRLWKKEERFFQLNNPLDYVRIFLNLAKETKLKEDKEYAIKLFNTNMLSCIDHPDFDTFKDNYLTLLLAENINSSLQIESILKFLSVISLKDKIKQFIFSRIVNQDSFEKPEHFFLWLQEKNRSTIQLSSSINQEVNSNHSFLFNSILNSLFQKFSLGCFPASFSIKEGGCSKESLLNLFSYLCEKEQNLFLESIQSLVDRILCQENFKSINNFSLFISSCFSFILNIEYSEQKKISSTNNFNPSIQAFLFHPFWEQESTLEQYELICDDLINKYHCRLNDQEIIIAIAEVLLFKKYLVGQVSELAEDEVDLIILSLEEVLKRNDAKLLKPVLAFVYQFITICKENSLKWHKLCQLMIQVIFKSPHLTIHYVQGGLAVNPLSHRCSFFFGFFILGMIDYDVQTFKHIFRPLMQAYLDLLKKRCDQDRAETYYEFFMLLSMWKDRNFLCDFQENIVSEFIQYFDQFIGYYPSVMDYLEKPLYGNIKEFLECLAKKVKGRDLKNKIKLWEVFISKYKPMSFSLNTFEICSMGDI